MCSRSQQISANLSSRTILSRTGFVFVCCCLLVATWAAALDLPKRVQPAPAEVPTYTVQRVAQGLVVDGKADEADWQQAAPMHLIFPWNDVERDAVQHTVAKMLWDANNLYIVFLCDDPYINAELVAHDSPTYNEDAVEIFATPNSDDVSKYYGYEMNVRGTLLDYITFWRDGTRMSGGRGWQSEGVQIATTIDGTLNDDSDIDKGWIFEMAIPHDNFRHLGGRIPPQDGDMWRLNLNRCAGKTQGQYSVWSDTHAPQASFHHSDYFGKVYFSDVSVGSKNK